MPFLAFDAVPITKNRVKTADGFLIAKNSTIARTGIQHYRAHELGLDKQGYPSQQIIKLYRPHDEVFHPESLASFDNKPVTMGHPADPVTAKNWAQLAKGEAVRPRQSADKMVVDLIIKSFDAIQAIESGTSELSNGYLFDLDLTPGMINDTGESYDGIQRNIRGNHVAIVDKARCGSVCRVSDSFNFDFDEDTNMAATTEPVMRKMVIDGIPVEVNDTAAAAIEKLQKAIIDTVAAKDVAEKQLNDSLAALKTEHEKQINELKAQVMTPEARDAMVEEWSQLLVEVKDMAPDLQTKGMTCEQIRRKMIETAVAKDTGVKGVVDAILAPTGKTVADADPLTIKTAYAAMKAVKPAVKTETQSGFGLDLLNVGDVKDGEQKLVGRDAMIQHDLNAWKGKPN
jgi:hypothetical protein